jgi:hypothetical protein
MAHRQTRVRPPAMYQGECVSGCIRQSMLPIKARYLNFSLIVSMLPRRLCAGCAVRLYILVSKLNRSAAEPANELAHIASNPGLD